MKDGIVYRQCTPGPTPDSLLAPIITASYQTRLLQQCLNAISARHVGPKKTASKMCELGYWVGLVHDCNQYCSKCVTYQSSEPPVPQKVLFYSVPTR